MSDSVKNTLEKLREQLDSSDSVSPETLATAQELEAQIQQLLDADQGNITSSVDAAMSLEAQFENDHPVIASVVRELINALHKMGV